MAAEELSWKFSNSKRIFSTPPLYRAVPQVLEIRVPLLKKEDIHQGENAVSLGFHREDTRKWDGKSISALEVWVSELKGKKNYKKRNPFVQNFPENCCFSFQWAVPKRVERLILVLILIKILFICIYKKGTTNTVSRTRGPLPSSGWGNMVYWTV